MSGRGRKASLPQTPLHRPPVLVGEGLVVEHLSPAGKVARFDFTELPLSEALQYSLAKVFAARCVAVWTSHGSSRNYWWALGVFAAFLAKRPEPVADMGSVTASMWTQWQLSRPRTWSSHNQARHVSSLLLDDPQLPAATREALAARRIAPTTQEVSFARPEFEQIATTARRSFRAAHGRIADNARHLADWRSGAVAKGTEGWLLGEALDHLARTGDVPRNDLGHGRGTPVRRYLPALGGDRSQDTWQRLFLTRGEATALGVLLVAEHGWNLSVIDRMRVPRAAPDPGLDGRPVYRVELEKHRRGSGRYFETRNLTDHGASSQGRLITQALEATVFARTAVEALIPGTDRLIIWRTGNPGLGSGAGPFRTGVTKFAAANWADAAGLDGSPFRRSRRTVNVMHRREPGQNSQDTHDSVYVLPDRQAQQAAIPVIAAAADDLVATARRAVLQAELRAAPAPGDLPTATADCHDYDHSPFPSAEGGCGASFLMCLACPNARIHPGHHPRLAVLHLALANLRSAMDPASWHTDWGDTHDRLEHLASLLTAPVWAASLAAATDRDLDLVNHLLAGDLDL